MHDLEGEGTMAACLFPAEPYRLEFDPEPKALLIIDMQRDFGFWESRELLGNEVGCRGS
jgi:isochorismate hydrolase